MNTDDLKKIAESNPKVDVQAMEKLKSASEALHRAGFGSKHEYRIEPPLGRKSESVALLALRKA